MLKNGPKVKGILIGQPTPAALAFDAVTPIQMPTTYLYQLWRVIMTGVATVTGWGDDSVASMFTEGPENLMNLLTVVPTKQNGAGIPNQQFKCANAAHFAFNSMIDGGGVPVSRQIVVPTGNGAYDFGTTPEIRFSWPNLTNLNKDGSTSPANPDDSALDSRHLQSLFLNVQCSDVGALGTLTGGAVALSDVQVQVYASYIDGESPTTVNGQLVRRRYIQETQQKFAMTGQAEQTNYTFQNMRSSNPLRRLIAKTTIGASNFAEVSDQPFGGNAMNLAGPLVQFRVNAEQEVLSKAVYQHIQLQNARTYGLIVPWPVGRIVYEPEVPVPLQNYTTFDVTADIDPSTTEGQQTWAEFTFQEDGFFENKQVA